MWHTCLYITVHCPAGIQLPGVQETCPRDEFSGSDSGGSYNGHYTGLRMEK